jgi:DNA-directed RNA polymerase beta' subunit
LKKKQALRAKRPNVLILQDAYKQYKSDQQYANEDIEMGNEEDVDHDGEDDSGELVADEEDESRLRPAQEALPKSASGKVKTMRGRNERVLAAEECRAHLRRLFKNEAGMCSLIFGRHGPFAPLVSGGFSLASADMFFMDVIPVAPTRFRPPVKMNDTLFEHPQNELLGRILATSYRLRDLNNDLRLASQKSDKFDATERKRVMGALLDRIIQLQVDVNSFIDSNKNPQPVRQGKLPPAGVKQGLEKKEGLFRKHMMVCFITFGTWKA